MLPVKLILQNTSTINQIIYDTILYIYKIIPFSQILSLLTLTIYNYIGQMLLM